MVITAFFCYYLDEFENNSFLIYIKFVNVYNSLANVYDN